MTVIRPPVIDADRTLGDLVAEVPARARVFERAGLDYCCHGRRTLAEACVQAGLDPSGLAVELAAVEDRAGADVAGLAPVELVEHILATHHAYLHDELPALEALAAKVRDAHQQRHPELARVAELVVAVRADLEPHLAKEEQVLFPAIQRLAATPDGLPSPVLEPPVLCMFTEHEQAGALLGELRAVAGDYVVPADGCPSYRSLYDRLAALEADTFQHIHLENNVLFPEVAAI